MKLRLSLLTLITILGLTANAQDSLNVNKLVWTGSLYQNGFGHMIYTKDPGNKTVLNIAARHNSKTWTDMVTMTSDGKVGINVPDPLVRFSVGGDVNISGNLSSSAITTGGNYVTTGQIRINQTAFKGSPAGLKLGDYATPLADIEFVASSYMNGFGTRLVPVVPGDVNGTTLLKFQGRTNSNNWSDLMILNNRTRTVTTTGRLLVNDATDDDTTALKVNGTIAAKRIKVTQSQWPDYVFADNYELPSLYETARFIHEKKHLPGIPTAKEAETTGIDVGEMNRLLLEKVEELTLYIIDLQKRLDKLAPKNQQ